MAQLFNMKSVLNLVEILYGIEPSIEDFEDIVMTGWKFINMAHTRLYRYIGDVEDGELELPCNVMHVESVHIPITNAKDTSADSSFLNIRNINSERYVEGYKRIVNSSEYHAPGKMVQYREGDGKLYFDKNYKKVLVIYHGILADEEDGLPLINEKERIALATFVAYSTLYRDGIRKRDANALKISQDLQQKWLRLCNAARIPEHLSQNDMDAILDVQTRWDRKHYGISFEPII